MFLNPDEIVLDTSTMSSLTGRIFKSIFMRGSFNLSNFFFMKRQLDYEILYPHRLIESNEMKEKETDDFIIRSPSPYTAFYNVKKKMGNWSRDLVDRQGFDIEI